MTKEELENRINSIHRLIPSYDFEDRHQFLDRLYKDFVRFIADDSSHVTGEIKALAKQLLDAERK